MARYNDLMAVVEGAPWATDDVLARLRALESEGPETGPPLWESVVMGSGAADDDRVIEAARRVWETLGSNAYAVQFKARPQTWRGFLEGRGWAVLGMTGLVVIAIIADEVSRRWGWYWLLVLPLFIAWPALIYIAFRWRYRGLEERGGKELPHLNCRGGDDQETVVARYRALRPRPRQPRPPRRALPHRRRRWRLTGRRGPALTRGIVKTCGSACHATC